MPLVACALALWSGAAFTVAARTESARFGSNVRPSSLALIAAAIAVGSAAAQGFSADAALGAAFVLAAIAAAGPDSRHGQLFDTIVFPMATIGLVMILRPERTLGSISGALIFGGIFALVHLCSRGRAIGLGDVKMLFAFGAVFGPFASILGMGAACASGALVALAGRKVRRREIFFGPHLAFGALVALAAGPAFVHAYLHL